MRTPRRQRPHRAHHFAPPLLDADSNLRGVTGLRCSSVWIVAARRQALGGPHASNWGER